MEEFVARRTKLAEAKIGQAEAQALADVRAAAADAAVAAAEKILRDTAKGKVADDLVAQRHRRREGEAELTRSTSSRHRSPDSSRCRVTRFVARGIRAQFPVHKSVHKLRRPVAALSLPATASIILPREST